MPSISASVGVGGVNKDADVRIVQQLLKDAGLDPGPVDGDFGDVTKKAIVDFQKTFMSNPDGRIDPGGSTLKRLAPSGAAAAPAPAPSSGASAGSADWSGDSSKWQQDKKLASLEPAFRAKVEKVIAKLKADGFQPTIVFGWRSVAVQAKLKAEGKTKVSFSFHNAQKPDGTPNALAVDICDTRWAWKEPDCHKFFKALGAAGKAEGLVWGGDWVSFRDWAHLQGRQNNELARVRSESGL